MAALLTRPTVATHGMMFLHNLDLTDNGSVTLPDVEQEDNADVRAELKISLKSSKDRSRFNVETVRYLEYPLGLAPTWSQVKDTLKKNPLLMIRPWERPAWMYHIPTSAGALFVKFTKSIWACIKSDWWEGSSSELEGLSSLDSAMTFWSAHSIQHSLKAVSFAINRSGIKGAVPGGKEVKSFRDRTKIYFPDEDAGTPPRGSKWVPFFSPQVGYIKHYHDKLRTMRREEDRESFIIGLEDIFAHLQCLPDSESFTETKEGKTWSRATGEEGITILVNANHLKFREIGRVRQVKDGPTRAHVTKANKDVLADLYKQNGLMEESIELQSRRWRARRKQEVKKKSKRAKNARIPPKRKNKEKEKGSSSEDDSEDVPVEKTESESDDGEDD